MWGVFNKRRRLFGVMSVALVVTFTLMAGCSGSESHGADEEDEGAVYTTSEQTVSEFEGFSVVRLIDQNKTAFGESGCGGAAGLMALQAAGYLADYDNDEKYASFWSCVPKAADASKGFNGAGIWNPALADWLSNYASVERIEGFDTDDIKEYISAGNVVIPLVSLGETGDSTHWFAVTAWKIKDGILLFEVADPWSGVLHEYTSARLQSRMEEGARRKSAYGQGDKTDGVLIKALQKK